MDELHRACKNAVLPDRDDDFTRTASLVISNYWLSVVTSAENERWVTFRVTPVDLQVCTILLCRIESKIDRCTSDCASLSQLDLNGREQSNLASSARQNT